MAKLTFAAIFLGLSHFFSAGNSSQPVVHEQASAPANNNINTMAASLSSKAQNLDPHVVELSLIAYNKAREQGLDPQQVLTIVDYSKPSTQDRMWIFDLKTQRLLFENLVAHGKDSGNDFATSFSDLENSHKSSLGLFLTDSPYIGHHGYSLKLTGLEKGFNDMAAAREIVVHAANYVNVKFAAMHGMLGRSWGCFAVNPRMAKPIINTIKDGSLLFAYYPDQNWLRHSNYLT